MLIINFLKQFIIFFLNNIKQSIMFYCLFRIGPAASPTNRGVLLNATRWRNLADVLGTLERTDPGVQMHIGGNLTVERLKRNRGYSLVDWEMHDR